MLQTTFKSESHEFGKDSIIRSMVLFSFIYLFIMQRRQALFVTRPRHEEGNSTDGQWVRTPLYGTV